MRKSALLAGLICLFIFNFARSNELPLFEAADLEMNRAMTELKSQPNPPYFISYSITETESVNITASFGKVKIDTKDLSRILDVDVRVGSYKFDNTHIIRGNAFNFSFGGGTTTLPLDNDIQSIRSAIWYATDKNYKTATEKYEKAITNVAVKVKEEDSSADFSHETPQIYIGEDKSLSYDKDFWKERVKKLSEMFTKDNKIYQGDVTFQAERITKYFINSEGTKIKWSDTYYRVFAMAHTKADDGMKLPLHKSYFSFSAAGLPDEKTMIADVQKMVDLLKDLRNAPQMNTYTGPAILSGEAAGVFFHEIFGHRVEGHREKDPNSSQTFKQSVGKKILPDFIDVIFNPTIRVERGTELSGYYRYDDEGVKASEVKVVDNGVFKEFLMSRSPIDNFPHSNGHGRSQGGYEVCSRQSNLIVVAHKTCSKDSLRTMLREECKKQGKEFGLFFDVVQGGFTFTSRTIPNAFNVLPIVVHKIYADGKPDELVRGVDLIGTPLTTLSNIIAAADDFGVFNGICGAESGRIPVSADSPSLLVSTIEVQKKQKSQAKPPLLPSPFDIEP